MSDDLGIDPYESANDCDSQPTRVVYEQVTEYRRERRLYRQLIAMYQSIKDHQEAMIAETIVVKVWLSHIGQKRI